MLVGDRYVFHGRVNSFVAGRKKAGFFVYYGGGKTYLALRWRETLELPVEAVTIVLCPSGLIPQWVEQASTLGGLTVVPVVGSGPKRLKALQSGANFFVMGYDAVRNIHVRLALKRLGVTCAIVDESTRIKNQRTARFKALHDIFQHVPYRAILTGRPIEEDPDELFAQMLFLDNGVTFGRSYGQFRHTYFQPGPSWDPWKWRLRKDAPHRIAMKLRAGGCIYISKAEVQAELPPVEKNYIELPLSELAMRLYKAMRKEFRIELPSGEVVDTIWATTKAIKLQQIAAGVVYIDPKMDVEGNVISSRGVEVVDTTKIEWLKESLPEMLLESSVLVWSCFTSAADLIQAALGTAGIPYERYSSDMTPKERIAAVERWNTGTTNSVFILSQQLACEGLNLQRAKHAVFFTVSPAAAKLDNAMARNMRSGSEKLHDKIVYWMLCGKGTVDGKIVKAIVEKRSVGDAILDHLREE